MDLTKLFITHPGHGRVFHIYGKSGPHRHRSLCCGSMMLGINPEMCEEVTDATRWVKGQDCKACFRKAGLLLDTAQGE